MALVPLRRSSVAAVASSVTATLIDSASRDAPVLASIHRLSLYSPASRCSWKGSPDVANTRYCCPGSARHHTRNGSWPVSKWSSGSMRWKATTFVITEATMSI